MFAPRVILVTCVSTVPEAELLARIEAVAELPSASRALVAVMLRDPELEGRALHRWGGRLREATARVGARLIVNDRLDLAIALGADGVHLGRRSVSVADARSLLGSKALVSVSCHAVGEELAARAVGGVDALLLSPIGATPGKGPPLGLPALTDARAWLDRGAPPRPALIALGGVDAGAALDCLRAGADGVAVIRADLRAVLADLTATSAPPGSA